MNMKNITKQFFRKMNRLFVASKKIIRSNDKNYGLRSLASLFVFFFVLGQAIKEFFFRRQLETAILFLLLVSYVAGSDRIDEHVILTIAMLACLYLSYDTLTSLIKGELRTRNDQIYRQSLDNVQEQIKVLTKKKKLIQDLDTFSYKVEQIKNSSGLTNLAGHISLENFGVVTDLQKNLEAVLYEELYYLDLVHNTKNSILEKLSSQLDENYEFTDSKIEEIVAQ